jgi:hypothetical protein
LFVGQNFPDDIEIISRLMQKSLSSWMSIAIGAFTTRFETTAPNLTDVVALLSFLSTQVYNVFAPLDVTHATCAQQIKTNVDAICSVFDDAVRDHVRSILWDVVDDRMALGKFAESKQFIQLMENPEDLQQAASRILEAYFYCRQFVLNCAVLYPSPTVAVMPSDVTTPGWARLSSSGNDWHVSYWRLVLRPLQLCSSVTAVAIARGNKLQLACQVRRLSFAHYVYQP